MFQNFLMVKTHNDKRIDELFFKIMHYELAISSIIGASPSGLDQASMYWVKVSFVRFDVRKSTIGQ